MSEPAYVCMECARTTSGRCVQHSYVSIPEQDILSGKYVGSAEQDSERDNENAALRKRVEELERESKDRLDRAYASEARAEKAEADFAFMVNRACDEKLDGYRELGARAAAAEERAEKAERERDEFARKAVGMELVWSGTNAELEDALDYALWLRSVTGLEPANLDAEREDPEPYPGEQVEDRVLALLEKRREENRG